jgi:hypothetical protein
MVWSAREPRYLRKQPRMNLLSESSSQPCLLPPDLYQDVAAICGEPCMPRHTPNQSGGRSGPTPRQPREVRGARSGVYPSGVVSQNGRQAHSDEVTGSIAGQGSLQGLRESRSRSQRTLCDMSQSGNPASLRQTSKPVLQGLRPRYECLHKTDSPTMQRHKTLKRCRIKHQSPA